MSVFWELSCQFPKSPCYVVACPLPVKRSSHARVHMLLPTNLRPFSQKYECWAAGNVVLRDIWLHGSAAWWIGNRCLLVRLLHLSPQTAQTAPKNYPILLCDISKDKRAGIQGCLAKYPCPFFSGISLWVFFIRYRKDGKKRILIGPPSSQIKCGVKTGVVLQVR